VEETLQGRSNQVKEYTIGVQVLHKPADFDPKQDGIVRIHASRLRIALSRYYAISGVNDPIRISVPRGCYVPVFTCHTQQENIEQRCLHAALNEPGSLVQQAPLPSLAVLPFHCLGHAIASLSFAAGLASKLNTELSSLRAVSVVAYYPMRHLAHTNAKFREVLREVGATYVITGDIQNVHRCYRVNIQLIHAQSAHQVWSQTFDSEGNHHSRFAIQDGLVKQIIRGVTAIVGSTGKPLSRKVSMAVA
jgi:TolB-like protein